MFCAASGIANRNKSSLSRDKFRCLLLRLAEQRRKVLRPSRQDSIALFRTLQKAIVVIKRGGELASSQLETQNVLAIIEQIGDFLRPYLYKIRPINGQRSRAAKVAANTVDSIGSW